MFLVVGLGNPGDSYAETRHNAGFWFLDALLQKTGARLSKASRLHAETARLELAGVDCLLARPVTFMNESGRAVRALLDYYRLPVSHLLVAYDELDLAPGTVRLKLGGGHGGHNGLRDICQHLESADFGRLRIGIGHPGHRDMVTPWVLGRAGAEDTGLIHGAIERALGVIDMVLQGRFQQAQTALHTEQE